MSLPKAEWVDRCAARYVERSKIELAQAKELAEENYTASKDFWADEESPEDAADNDMDCWDDDEGER